MASRPLASWSAPPASAPLRPRLRAVAAGASFSDLEWSIVAMAERDGLASLRQPNRFWSLVRRIFGIRPANRLANDRLEMLRRVAVLLWRGKQDVAQSEMPAFLAAGFSPAHFGQLQQRIAAASARLAAGAAR